MRDVTGLSAPLPEETGGAVPAPGALPQPLLCLAPAGRAEPRLRRAGAALPVRSVRRGFRSRLPSSLLPVALGPWMNASPGGFHGTLPARVPFPHRFHPLPLNLPHCTCTRSTQH